MIRLSPKALRFVDHAALTFVDDASVPADDHGAWQRWRTDHAAFTTGRRSSGTNAYVDVPIAVARVYLTAVDHLIGDLNRRFESEGDEDGDLENDLAFLDNVRDVLSDGLGHRGGRVE